MIFVRKTKMDLVLKSAPGHKLEDYSGHLKEGNHKYKLKLFKLPDELN